MRKSTQVAIGGVASSLCLLMMFLTGLIPFSTYCFPAFAGIVLIAVAEENGPRTAVMVYVATSVLSLFIVPDREAVMLFIMLLGYYPTLKPYIERLGRLGGAAVKAALFNGTVIAFYYVMLFVFGVPDLLEGWGDFGRFTVVVALGLVNFTLFTYDFLLTETLRIYRYWFRPKILHKLF